MILANVKFNQGSVWQQRLRKFSGRDAGYRFFKNLEGIDDPRRIGQALTGNKRGYWRCRIGDCHLICVIEDENPVIIALNIGYRREVYK